MTRFIIFLLIALGFSNSLISQIDVNEQIVIKGQIVDQSTGEPIEFATITLIQSIDSSLIDGTTSDFDGNFELLASIQDFFLDVSYIGYQNKVVAEFQINKGVVFLGEIAMELDSKLMEEVIVRAEKSSTEFRLDKRVFNVGKDLSSNGASALEVLNNVPSVNVDIEGAVTLRGSGGVQILIDGKPSILTDDQGNALGTITAEMIDKVEVITNPSAKYEAEGTSGIINIVLKKNEKEGLNGSFSINTGVPHNHSVGVSVNKRNKRFNVFSQGGVGYKELPSRIENILRDNINRTVLTTDGDEYRNELFYNFILGADYYINKLNVITLSGSFAYEVEDQPSTTNFSRMSFDGSNVAQWTRSEVTEATNPKFQYELKYKKDFEDHKEHQLLFSAIGNYFGKDQSSEFTNLVTEGSLAFGDQLTATAFEEGKYTFNLDYTKPFNEAWTIETGLQYVTNHVNNDFEVQNQVDSVFVVDEGLTNVFDYDQKVLGVYGTTAYESDLWGIKLGLRLENTDLTTILENTNETNNQNFNSLFPSAHTSYQLSDRVSLQAGYSRRIYRPRLWDLNPFFNIRNNFNVRAGNPQLLPEFTDSYEVGSIFIFEDISFNFNVYYRFTEDVIERVSIFDDGVNIFKPFNIGTNQLTGLEYNFKYTLNKLLSFNGDANYNLFNRKGNFNDQNFDFSSDQWSGKLTARLKLNKKLELESTGQYQSRVQTVQGRQSENLFADLGVRFKMLDGRAVLNLSVRDVFASRIRENVSEQSEFYVYHFRQRGRFITLGFSYGFGKGEAMEFTGRRR